jgi:hypothetical protein
MTDHLPVAAEGADITLQGGDGVAHALNSFMANLNGNAANFDGVEVSVHHTTRPDGEWRSVLSYRAYRHRK